MVVNHTIITLFQLSNLKVQQPVPSSSPKNIGLNLDSSVCCIKGVKEYLAGKLSKLGVERIRDLLYLFPRYHIDYSQRTSIAKLPLPDDERLEMSPQTIVVNIWESKINKYSGKTQATEVIFGDETGNASAIWFNQPYLVKKFPVNARVIISGKYKVFKGKITFQSPDWDLEDKEAVHAGRMVPVYSLTAGLYQKSLRNLIKHTVDIWTPRIG